LIVFYAFATEEQETKIALKTKRTGKLTSLQPVFPSPMQHQSISGQV